MSKHPEVEPKQEPINLLARRRIKGFVEKLPNIDQRRVEFKAGQVLLREGDLLHDTPALLIVDGVCEEKTSCFIPGQGNVHQTVKRVMEGQITNLQALVPGFRDRPSLCSIQAIESGHAVRFDYATIRSLHEVGWLLTEHFRHLMELQAALNTMNALYGGLFNKLQDIRTSRPDIPAEPNAIIQGLIDSLHRIEELNGRQYEIDQEIATAYNELKEAADELGEKDQLLASQADQIKAQGEEIDRLNSVLAQTSRNNQELTEYYRTLEGLIEQRDESISAKNKTIEQQKKRIEALTAPSASGRIYAKDDPRLAFRVLVEESENAKAATESAEKARREAVEAHREAEKRLNQMHRAIELLSKTNPNVRYPVEVMLLLLGEEPPKTVPPTTRSNPADDIDRVFQEVDDLLPGKPRPKK